MQARFQGQAVAAEVTRRIPLFLSLLLLAPLTARAQTFTNSATLSATVSGTNLLINYSLTTTQGWVTLFAADRPDQLTTKARPVDLAQVPSSMQGQFTVPLDAAAPAQFYKLLIEQWPSRGKALVWTNGAVDFAAMRLTYGAVTNNPIPYATNTAGQTIYKDYGTNSTPLIFKEPVAVWLDNLGAYDTNGVLVGGNGNLLNGKYGATDVYSINNPGGGYPPIGRLVSSGNDFRVNYTGDTNATVRQAAVWCSEVQLYYYINDYRKRFLNDTFIDELNLPPDLTANLKQRQFRPDLAIDGESDPARLGIPILRVFEAYDNGESFPSGNVINVGSDAPWSRSLPIFSFAYSPDVPFAEYFTLASMWTLGSNTGLPGDAFWDYFSHTNMLTLVYRSLRHWVLYRYTGDPENWRWESFAYRVWSERPCGGTGVPCDKGATIRNVMMFDETNNSADSVFPYNIPSALVSGDDGPTRVQMASAYIGAIFYDIANESGLGIHKADLLIWKTLSLITNDTPTWDSTGTYPMRRYAGTIQQAARALWPDPRPGRTGLSRYEEDVADVLTSRGIPLNGVADFRTNLPVAIGKFPETLEVSSVNGFGSSHPESQPGANVYGNYSTSQNRYTDTNPSAAYVAYQFYKHSKYGPCDKLALTDGTFTVNPSAPFNWFYNSNGTFYVELTDRELGNLVLLTPGRSIRWMRSRQRCPNEVTGFYAEDVRPFGFRVIQATPNGFSFTATALSETATNKTYQLTIVDPSTNTLGAASYAWSFTNHLGTATSAAGSAVQYTATKDEPFTLSITRTRASITNTLTLRERGNDLDRSGGNAFVRNLVP